MATTPISMKKLKDILRLKYNAKLTHRQIAASLSISASVVSRYVARAAQMGITAWPLDAKWDDATLSRTFLQTKAPLKKHRLPDWLEVQEELKQRKLVTLQLLWEEYVEANPTQHYSYNHYCRMYRAWMVKQRLSMRQVHRAGEKLFVDYCGATVPIVHPETGETRFAQVFVAVLGASNYTYAEATESQKLEDWIMSHVRCFEYLGGVPDIIVPDNLRSAVSKTCRYEPDINPTYHQLAQHYDVAVIPARPYKPKDKAKAEVGVQIIERWIMGRIRKETFYTLAALNARIRELLIWVNDKRMKQYNESRRSLFERLDKPVLRALPHCAYQYTYIKRVKVNIDYHIEIDKHYYSVPHSLVKQTLEAHISGELVKIYHQDQLVATHPRARSIGRHSTDEQHMPKAHQVQLMSPQRIEKRAQAIGEHTLRLVQRYLHNARHPEQVYRRCLGLFSKANKYSDERLNNACERALCTGATSLRQIENMLHRGLDSAPLPSSNTANPPQLFIEHTNIRGQSYYQSEDSSCQH